MAKIAEIEERSILFWGVYTLAVCLCFRYLISLPIPNILLGLIVSYITMLFLKIIQKN
ncbi:MAG: hypothetical protein ACTSUT_12615 [Promethearchaeota archaeon]